MTEKKKRSEKRKATKIVNLRLTESEMRLVISAAESHDVSVSSFIKNRIFDAKKLAFKNRSEKKEASARDQIKMLRVTPWQHAELMLLSEDAELSVSSYMRHKLFGYRTSVNPASLIVNEINRQKGMTKLIHIQSEGAYSFLTAEIVNQCVAVTFSLSDRSNKIASKISFDHAKKFCVVLREIGAQVKSEFDVHFTESPAVEVGLRSILLHIERLKEVVCDDSYTH